MTETFNTFIGKVEKVILQPIITLLALAALVVFVWGVVEYIANAGNDEARKKGQQHMVWGIVGFVIMFGANAIVAILTNTAGGIFGVAQ